VKRPSDFPINGLRLVAVTLLTAWVLTPAPAQQNQSPHVGLVDDWSHHHVIFSNPGTLEDAMMNGRREAWQRIVNDPRYRMQQVRRNAAFSQQASIPRFGFPGPPGPPEGSPVYPIFGNGSPKKNPLHTDWAVQIVGGSGGPAYLNVYPAKYTFSPVAAPSCKNDFVVFVTGVTGNSTQAANIFGFNNLYASTCAATGSIPTTLFAYFIGTGKLETSPALSLDGTKVAFVESITGGSKFHVLTMDKSGSSGNGTAFNSPAAPCTVNGVKSCSTNTAVDTNVTMSGAVMVTRSPPFVDYSGDIAYVGDDAGKLHKFTGVFTGTPAEAGSPWPFTVASGVTLSGPVFDSGTSQNILVGGSDGKLYCVTKAGAACSTPSITVGSGTSPAILDTPILDSTTERVLTEANSNTNAVLTETTPALGAAINLTTVGGSGTDLYSPAFDNAYYTSGGTGNLYFCGNVAGAATPELYQIPISNGIVGTPKAVFQLVNTNDTGASVDCSPLTEFFNSTQNIDYLFLSVKEHGFNTGTPNCQDNTCLMSFILPTTSPFTFPTTAKSTLAGGSLGPLGTSGMIVDNDSGTTGTSQIYFGNLQNNNATQVSQSGLQ